jgi:hypothetical protein
VEIPEREQRARDIDRERRAATGHGVLHVEVPTRLARRHRPKRLGRDRGVARNGAGRARKRRPAAVADERLLAAGEAPQALERWRDAHDADERSAGNPDPGEARRTRHVVLDRPLDD